VDDVNALIARYRFPGDRLWVRPGYDGSSIINLAASLLAHFGQPHGVPLRDGTLAQRLTGRRKVLLLLLDGLGWVNLEAAVARRPVIGDLLGSVTRVPLTSVFPSTTSAAMTSYFTGLPPSLHGIIGFLMAFPEYGDVFNMLNFTSPTEPKLNLPALGFNAERYIGHPSILYTLCEHGVLARGYTFMPYVESGLSRIIYHDVHASPYLALGDLLANMLSHLPADVPQLHILYWATLDNIGHTLGAGSEAYARELQMLLSVLRDQVAPALDGDTALLVCADHGHVDGDDNEAIDLMEPSDLRHLFRFPPAGEGRAQHLFLRDGVLDRARELLARFENLTALTKSEFLASGLLGPSPLHPGLEARIGDLLLLPHGSARTLYNYQPRPHTAMIGRHGGLTPEEMLVPLLIYT
jgi:hypothetical protein